VIARDARAELEAVYRAALAAIDPARALGAALRGSGTGLEIAGRAVPDGARVFVLAIGKAGGALAAAAETVLGARIAAGLALVPENCERALAHCELRIGAHPIPDERGAAATREILAFAARPGPNDVLLVLLSGGGSSLLCAPAPGIALADVAATVRLLLAGGASIDELNTVRKHLSAATGGRLARAAASAGRIEVLAISDVVGDRIDVIASGPFAPDPTRYGDALAVLARRDPEQRAPREVRAHLAAGARGEREETPKPGDPVFARAHHALIASNATALAAARDAAAARGWRAVAATSALAGEARDAARRLVALGDACHADGPLCLVAGGETVVTVKGAGHGGRSQELALAAALAIEGRSDVAVLAAGTDGADGPTDAAGAYADGGTVARGRRAGVDASAALADNDSHGFFCREGGAIRTGMTGTNAADLALVLRDPGLQGGRR
jgi:hydroxypyruvate reductase